MSAARELVLSAVLAAGLALSLSAEGFVGVSGALTLPQGGASFRRTAGAALRGGAYLSDVWAVEGAAAVQEDLVGLDAGVLVHWSAWEWYDRMFGYSAFDPFLTCGARGWFGREPGQVGPKAGVGAFWHLSDRWSLRFGADVALGLDTRVETFHTLEAGVQYAF